MNLVISKLSLLKTVLLKPSLTDQMLIIRWSFKSMIFLPSKNFSGWQRELWKRADHIVAQIFHLQLVGRNSLNFWQKNLPTGYIKKQRKKNVVWKDLERKDLLRLLRKEHLQFLKAVERQMLRLKFVWLVKGQTGMMMTGLDVANYCEKWYHKWCCEDPVCTRLRDEDLEHYIFRCIECEHS